MNKKTAMKYRPDKITVGGIDFEIVYKTMKHYGELDFEARKINISNEIKEEFLFDTIMHEAFHAVCAIAGLSYIIEDAHPELEEAIVRASDNLFFPFFKEHYREFSELFFSE
tara:strand:+ start:401 stop:736 length:336 start_codon:yes stop_codon:yes gene_type:complete